MLCQLSWFSWFQRDFDEYIFYNDFIAVAEIGMVADSGSGMIKKSSSAFYYFLLFDFLDIFLFLLLFFNLPSSFQRVLSSRNGPNCNPNHPQAGSGWGTVNIAESWELHYLRPLFKIKIMRVQIDLAKNKKIKIVNKSTECDDKTGLF